MAFIDEMELRMRAGKGGDGIVAWRQEKFVEYGGPAGGNGGRGGDVYVRGVRDYGILSKYRNMKEFAAENGQDGGQGNAWGHNGKDFVLDVPVGAVLTKVVDGAKTAETFEVLREGELVFLLKGGKAGFGNSHFKASTNVSPEQFTLGKAGEEGEFHLEVRMIVDLGFVGFPNAGKSSLLNAITAAKAKVASYQFTTLEPNLGELFGFILADIPGLIEGASEGRGLGHKFLRHVERTKAVLHCISLENEDIGAAYRTIREELSKYSEELGKKPEIILLTKTDTVTPEVVAAKMKEAKMLSKNTLGVFSVSAINDTELKTLKDELIKLLRVMQAKEQEAMAKEAEKIAEGREGEPEFDRGHDPHHDSPIRSRRESDEMELEGTEVRFVSPSKTTEHLRERVGRAIKKMLRKKNK